MIFKPVTKSKNKTEKDFCVELTQVYRRLVEVYCQKNGIPFLPQAGNDAIAEELCEIGIIESASDMDALKVFLGKDYAPFAEAVSFAAEHKTELKTTLFKLYNSVRTLLSTCTNWFSYSNFSFSASFLFCLLAIK